MRLGFNNRVPTAVDQLEYRLVLPAVICEASDFPHPHELLASKNITVDCGKVSRINSSGVRAWIRYFSGLRNTGIKLRFDNCPASIVQALLVAPMLIARDEVNSVNLPYFCTHCNRESQFGVDMQVLAYNGAACFQARACGCGKACYFDDVESDFLTALRIEVRQMKLAG